MKNIFKLINKNLFKFNGNLAHLLGRSKLKSSKTLPVITISREMGAGGRPIAKMVVRRLGKPWRLYHKEIINRIVDEAKLERKLVEEVDEKKLSLIEETIYDLFGRQYVSLSNYYRHLIKVVTTISQRGYAVILGRGANFILPKALNVRIICDMKQRIKWEMKFEKISRATAIRRIKKSDDERRSFIKTLYDHTNKKAHHYDLVIRTGDNLSIYDAVDLILLAAKKRFKL